MNALQIRQTRRRTRSALPIVLCVPVLLLAHVPSARADHAVFTHRLDSASVVGNVYGGGGCSEDFNAGLGSWSVGQGDPTVSGGFVVFEAPGAVNTTTSAVIDLAHEREEIGGGCDLTAGAGDAEMTTVWDSTVPLPPGNTFGHQLAYATSASSVEVIGVAVQYLDADVAAEFGVAPGLFIRQTRSQFSLILPDEVELLFFDDVQSVAITEAQLEAATGHRVHLRLTYDELASTVVASYSLDGGSTFQTPFFADSSDYGLIPVPGLFQIATSDFRSEPGPDGIHAQLDSVEVSGTASGGAGCFADFIGGLDGWPALNGTPTPGGGVVLFEDPGVMEDVFQTVHPLTLERVDLLSSSACMIVKNGGDATLTSEWVNHLPDTGSFYGHQISYAISPTLVEAITLFVQSPSAAIATHVGTAAGLQVGLTRLLIDISDPGDPVLAQAIETQVASVSEGALDAATGQRILLRLESSQTSETADGSYSLNGGASYVSPFTPVDTSVGAFPAAPILFQAVGGQVGLVPWVPLLMPGGALLLGISLVVGALATVRRGGRTPRGGTKTRA